jgi:regulatory protein
MAVRTGRRRNVRPPLDEKRLEQAALTYVGRYGTTRAKLTAYLRRKIGEQGWSGAAEPAIEPLVERIAALGYVDDRAFAAARAAALGRRGYGERRVSAALRAAGVAAEDGEEARETARRGAWEAALRFAERRRIGPFAESEADRAGREKALGALLRAGHPLDLARRLAQARPGEIPELDIS